MNMTLRAYADAPAAGFAVTQGNLGILVNLLGQLYYPQGILFEASQSICSCFRRLPGFCACNASMI